MQHGDWAEWGLLAFTKASPGAQDLCFNQQHKCLSFSEQGLQQAASKGPANHRSWEAARSPSSWSGGGGMEVGKWLGTLHSSHLQVAAILAQERAGKTHLSWKALPVGSSHRCTSYTPAHWGERHAGNPSLSMLYEVRRYIYSPSRCCHKMLAPGQDRSMWVCSHWMLNLGQSLGLSTNLLPMQIVNALTLRSNSLQLQSESLLGVWKPSFNRVLCCRNKNQITTALGSWW